MSKLITSLRVIAALAYGLWMLPALAREAAQNEAAHKEG